MFRACLAMFREGTVVRQIFFFSKAGARIGRLRHKLYNNILPKKISFSKQPATHKKRMGEGQENKNIYFDLICTNVCTCIYEYIYFDILDFKLSPCTEYSKFPLG